MIRATRAVYRGIKSDWPVSEVMLARMNATSLTLRQFQQHIREKYYATDVARGTPMTWLWFSEEIGELARALARRTDAKNLEEEFADVIAWLCTLANINDVDLAAAVERKYLADGGPAGVK